MSDHVPRWCFVAVGRSVEGEEEPLAEASIERRKRTYVAFQSALEDQLLSHIVKSLSRQTRGSMVEIERVSLRYVPLLTKGNMRARPLLCKIPENCLCGGK